MKRIRRGLALSRETIRALSAARLDAVRGAKGNTVSVLRCSIPDTTCTSCPSYGADSNCCLATTQRFC